MLFPFTGSNNQPHQPSTNPSAKKCSCCVLGG